MAGAARRAQIVLIPVYRRHWVFTCREAQPALAAGAEGGRHLDREGGLASAWRRAWGGVAHRVKDAATARWHAASMARRGTLSNYTYRFGQWAMSLAHHDETFLNSVPPAALEMELIFPASMQERYVRRRLRLLIRGRMEYHKCWALIWGALTVPQLPLLITPIPNLPIYFSLYRTWSHYRAWRGAGSLQHIIVDIDARQLQRLRRALLEMQAGGKPLPSGGWPAELIAQGPRFWERLQPPTPGVVACFTKSHALEEIIQPAQLWREPVSDQQVEAAAAAFSFSTREVLAHVARARGLALRETHGREGQ